MNSIDLNKIKRRMKTMSHESTHDKIVLDLEHRLKDDMGFVDTWPFEVYCMDNTIYESDLVAVKNNNLYMFEIKSSDSYKNLMSATVQLLRDLEHFDRGKYDKVFMFYVYGTDNDRGYYCERLKLK